MNPSGVETNQADQTPVDSHAEGAAKPNGTNQNTSPPQPGEVERLRAYAASCERTTQDMIATTAKHFAEVERLREALKVARIALDMHADDPENPYPHSDGRALAEIEAALTPSESQEA